MAAGDALFADDNIEAVVDVPELLLDNGEDGFLLRVKGDSMIDAGLEAGDVIVVRSQEEANDGDIVVALVGDDEGAHEATVKRFRRVRGHVRLEPANAAYKPIEADFIRILGKVTGLLRRL